MVLGKSDVLGIDNFPTQITRLHEGDDSQQGQVFRDLQLPEEGVPLIETVEKIESSLIKEALTRTGGNKTKAAELLGVTRKIMRYKVEKYGLDTVREE